MAKRKSSKKKDAGSASDFFRMKGKKGAAGKKSGRKR